MEAAAAAAAGATDEAPPNPFTQYYAQLLHQGNMLQDSVRTGCYQQAILQNAVDFADKVVMDVGTGTGILAFFAVQAGARKVYAVEASDSAEAAQILVNKAGLQDKIEVVRGRIESVEIPEKVDVIVSEPIGFLLVHERMLESYCIARQRFLKPGGLMFPTLGTIVFSPCTDETVHAEQLQKIAFWQNENFFGVDLTPLLTRACEEYFAQPVVGFFSPNMLLSTQRKTHTFNFLTTTPDELQQFEIPFSFRVDKTAIMHGFGCWFDISFAGSVSHVVLSTGPECPGTHWYQCRLLMREPLAVNRGQSISGSFKFRANNKFSYFIEMTVLLDGTDISSGGRINLQDQMYHYLTNPTSAQTVAGY